MTRLYQCDNCGETSSTDDTKACQGCNAEICDSCEFEINGVDNLCEECFDKKRAENQVEPS